MCWECDHPNATRADYLDYVRERMSQHGGWTIQPILGDRCHAPWSYTIGLTDFGIPELVMTGLSAARASGLLHVLVPPALEGVISRPGDRVHMTTDPPTGIEIEIELVRVAEPAVHLVYAAELFGPRIRALQLVYADNRGHWPWEAGFRGGRGGQPVLGPRAAQRAA